MIITINGQKIRLEEALDLQIFLERQGYGEMMVAVARNGTFIPKGTYESIIVEDGDEIEIVAPMQGG